MNKSKDSKKSNPKVVSVKTTIISISIAVSIAACVLLLVWIQGRRSNLRRRGHYCILLTKRTLNFTRNKVQEFKEATGRFPSSLAEIKYDRYHPEFESFPLYEAISDENGNRKEYDELNGLGGWYYNATTGEVKVNIIKPVKNYMYCLRQDENEIPADW